MSLNHPAAKFASQGHAHVSTDAQIKFLYYPLWVVPKRHTNLTKLYLSIAGLCKYGRPFVTIRHESDKK